ncbi:hypothetical protein ACU635_21160 [[Actinomadura] parvosata]|uniref:hypothetical protein n=1 Tax=[Actinomadura] parvosata TaxID=1955412 RepID=UPI00406C00A5
MPNSSTAGGISAAGGIGRRNSIVEPSAARTGGRPPITRPSSTPAAIATARPIAQPRSVSSDAASTSAGCVGSVSSPVSAGSIFVYVPRTFRTASGWSVAYFGDFRIAAPNRRTRPAFDAAVCCEVK